MYSPKKQQLCVAGMNRKTLIENRSPATWESTEDVTIIGFPSEESTSADSDAEDVGSEVSRTTSAARSSGSEVAKAKPQYDSNYS